jgi:hypothetical protein
VGPERGNWEIKVFEGVGGLDRQVFAVADSFQVDAPVEWFASWEELYFFKFGLIRSPKSPSVSNEN